MQQSVDAPAGAAAAPGDPLVGDTAWVGAGDDESSAGDGAVAPVGDATATGGSPVAVIDAVFVALQC